jgi:hypothetical protein
MTKRLETEPDIFSKSAETFNIFPLPKVSVKSASRKNFPSLIHFFHVQYFSASLCTYTSPTKAFTKWLESSIFAKPYSGNKL